MHLARSTVFAKEENQTAAPSTLAFLQPSCTPRTAPSGRTVCCVKDSFVPSSPPQATMLMSSYEAGPLYDAYYDPTYLYAQAQPHTHVHPHPHQQAHPPLPSPPHSPKYAWRVTTVDEDAHRHQITEAEPRPPPKGRRSQVPAETMSSFMSGPDPADGKFICLYGGCMRRFGRKYNIQSHIQTHLADRPFRCTVCAAGFVRRHDLLRHARIHGPSKDFVCGCGKGFSRMDALNRHRQRQICKGAMTKEEMAQARLETAPARRAKTLKKKASGSSAKSGTSGESCSEEADLSSNASSQGSVSPEMRTLAYHADATSEEGPSEAEQILSARPSTPPQMHFASHEMLQQAVHRHPLDGRPVASRYLQEPLTPARESHLLHQQSYLLSRAASHQGFAAHPNPYASPDQWVNPQLLSSQAQRASSHHGGYTSDDGGSPYYY